MSRIIWGYFRCINIPVNTVRTNDIPWLELNRFVATEILNLFLLVNCAAGHSYVVRALFALLEESWRKSSSFYLFLWDIQAALLLYLYRSCVAVCRPAVSKIHQVLKLCEIQEKLQSSFNTAAATDELTAGITFACLTSFDVDNSAPSFIVKRWWISNSRPTLACFGLSGRCLVFMAA